MERALLNDGNFFLETYYNNDTDLMCIVINYFMKLDIHDTLKKKNILIHPGEGGRLAAAASNYKFYNEIEILGVVIGGEKLHQLIQELHARRLLVNIQGFCLALRGDSLGRDRTFYPLFECFDWSKYGVIVSNPLESEFHLMWDKKYRHIKAREIWVSKGFPSSERYHKFGSYDDSNFSKEVDESQVIRLNVNANDMFISCKDGPILLWKVDSPVREIRNVKLMRVIDGLEDKGVEVNGVTLKGGKLLALRDELFGRQVMVNVYGWCLYYTRGERGVYYYYRTIYHLEWEKYGVPISGNSLLRDRMGYLSEDEPITEVVIPTITSDGNKNNNNEKDEKLDLLQRSLEEKQQELEDCEEKLKKAKERELRVLEKRLKEKGQQLLKCKSQLKKEKEVNCNKLFKEKNQELSNCKLELEDKEKELCRYKNHVKEIENELKECESQKNIEERCLCKSQLEDKEKRVEVKEQELLKCKSHLKEKEKELNCKKAIIKAPEEEEACM